MRGEILGAAIKDERCRVMRVWLFSEEVSRLRGVERLLGQEIVFSLGCRGCETLADRSVKSKLSNYGHEWLQVCEPCRAKTAMPE